ncbi:CDP-alcohol phosphatidyltransferase family protein, partial [Streptomyces broussonetiae]
VQGIALLLAGAELLPRPANLAIVLLALGSLVWSFGRDVRWLWRASRTSAQVPTEAPVLELAAR